MRILVLGGTSFIGHAISRTLIDHGHTVAICHRGRTEPSDLDRTHHIHTDRSNLGAVRRELASFCPEALIDTYALTRRDAEVAVANLPADIPAVVLSSLDVYEAFDGFLAGRAVAPLPLREDSALRSRRYLYRGESQPGVSDDYEKIDVEAVWSERGACILRLPMVYGPRDPQCREGFLLRRLASGRREIPIGAGNLLWSRAHVDDVAEVVTRAIENPATQGTIMNIAESVTPSIEQWMSQIAAAMSLEVDLVAVAEDAVPPDLVLTRTHKQHVVADTRLAEKLLFRGGPDLRERVSQSVAWHLQHKTWVPWTEEDAVADDFALQQRLA
ncbi:NAD-dependent epimerase/dehydratase family protein [Enemella sp. A6]|uniref:NAD-dependent epimerase/dehydratase family protein n=1 Tax=Enemella sp. A6 TaxID=3440152 RepID=UPI003EC0AB48